MLAGASEKFRTDLRFLEDSRLDRPNDPKPCSEDLTPLRSPSHLCIIMATCFSRATKRKKMEGIATGAWRKRPYPSGPVHQKTLLYLGDLNDSQHAPDQALDVLTPIGPDEPQPLSSPDCTPPQNAPALSFACRHQLSLHANTVPAGWLRSLEELGLDQFWPKTPPSRQGTDWARLLQFRGYPADRSGQDERDSPYIVWTKSANGRYLWGRISLGRQRPTLLGARFVCPTSPALFTHLQAALEGFFRRQYEVLLYDSDQHLFEAKRRDSQ